MKNPQDGIQMHVAQVSSNEIVANHCKADLLTRPFNAKIGVEACVAMGKAVKASPCSDVMWKSEKED